MAIYSETQKQEQFQSSVKNSISILLYEFATGTGFATRLFKAESPLAKEFVKGSWMEELKTNLYTYINSKSLTYTQAVSGTIKDQNIGNISFSPDQVGLLESAKKHFESNPTQFFIAGTDFILINSISSDGTANISIINQCNKGSLMLHTDKLGLLENDDRNVSSTPNDSNRPLSTTYQIIQVNIKIQGAKIKNKSDAPKIIITDNGRARIDNTANKINMPPPQL